MLFVYLLMIIEVNKMRNYINIIKIIVKNEMKI